MKWSVVPPEGSDRGLPTSLQISTWIKDSADALLWTDDLGAADALVVPVRSTEDLRSALKIVGHRPFLLFDASAGAAVAESCATTRPGAVVTTTAQTGVAHLLAHTASVRTTGSDLRLRNTGDMVLIVEGIEGQFERVAPDLGETILGRPTCVVRADERLDLRASVPSSASVESVGRAMTDPRIGLVILLPCARTLPDLPLAFGHDVVSERAPLLADWTLVPTISARSTGTRSSVGISDLMADDVLREWLAIAAGEGIRSHVEVAGAGEAIVDAMRLIELHGRAVQSHLGSVIPYLDRTQLGHEIDRFGSQPAAGH